MLVAAVLFAVLASSCAYYNTFYLARKYYFRATAGAPYEVDRSGSGQSNSYTSSIEYSKKVIAQYPKSKWVDDAYLLWARALIGRDDPLQTITMLQDFVDRFPKSDQRAEATFFLGLAYRNARRYTQAVESFDDFLKIAPRNPLVPYAYLERSRALSSLGRYAEAADAAGLLLERYPGHELADRARRQRAEARLQDGNYDGARADFHDIGLRATSDQERFEFLMREADCLEAARQYDAELELLRTELGHTPPPPPPAGVGTSSAGNVLQPGQTESVVQPGAMGQPRLQSQQTSFVASESYGRLTMRIGTALLLSGRIPEALAQYDHVMKDYPKTVLSAEAQYRIGYAYETGAEDFERAMLEYGHVKDQYGYTQFTQQAQQRSDDLARIMQFRHGSGADSLEKKAEAGFLTAERYLFELKKPDRALEEYATVARTYPGTAVAARALNAEAWVMSRKLGRKESADSLFWKVVREYPATEAQLAARDYLEQTGQRVPDSLIVPPKPAPPPPPDTTRTLTPIPSRTPSLGMVNATPDSLHRPAYNMVGPGGVARDSLGRPLPNVGQPQRLGAPGFPADSLGRPRGLFPPPASLPPSVPPADTARQGSTR